MVKLKEEHHAALREHFGDAHLVKALLDLSAEREKSKTFQILAPIGTPLVPDANLLRLAWNQTRGALANLLKMTIEYVKEIAWETVIAIGQVPIFLETFKRTIGNIVNWLGSNYPAYVNMSQLEKLFDKLSGTASTVWNYLTSLHAPEKQEQIGAHYQEIGANLSYLSSIVKRGWDFVVRVGGTIMAALSKAVDAIFYTFNEAIHNMTMAMYSFIETSVVAFEENVVYLLAFYMDFDSLSDEFIALGRPYLIDQRMQQGASAFLSIVKQIFDRTTETPPAFIVHPFMTSLFGSIKTVKDAFGRVPEWVLSKMGFLFQCIKSMRSLIFTFWTALKTPLTMLAQILFRDLWALCEELMGYEKPMPQPDVIGAAKDALSSGLVQGDDAAVLQNLLNLADEENDRIQELISKESDEASRLSTEANTKRHHDFAKIFLAIWKGEDSQKLVDAIYGWCSLRVKNDFQTWLSQKTTRNTAIKTILRSAIGKAATDEQNIGNSLIGNPITKEEREAPDLENTYRVRWYTYTKEQLKEYDEYELEKILWAKRFAGTPDEVSLMDGAALIENIVKLQKDPTLGWNPFTYGFQRASGFDNIANEMMTELLFRKRIYDGLVAEFEAAQEEHAAMLVNRAANDRRRQFAVSPEERRRIQKAIAFGIDELNLSADTESEILTAKKSYEDFLARVKALRKRSKIVRGFRFAKTALVSLAIGMLVCDLGWRYMYEMSVFDVFASDNIAIPEAAAEATAEAVDAGVVSGALARGAVRARRLGGLLLWIGKGVVVGAYDATSYVVSAVAVNAGVKTVNGHEILKEAFASTSLLQFIARFGNPNLSANLAAAQRAFEYGAGFFVVGAVSSQQVLLWTWSKLRGDDPYQTGFRPRLATEWVLTGGAMILGSILGTLRVTANVTLNQIGAVGYILQLGGRVAFAYASGGGSEVARAAGTVLQAGGGVVSAVSTAGREGANFFGNETELETVSARGAERTRGAVTGGVENVFAAFLPKTTKQANVGAAIVDDLDDSYEYYISEETSDEHIEHTYPDPIQQDSPWNCSVCGEPNRSFQCTHCPLKGYCSQGCAELDWDDEKQMHHT